MNKSKALLQKFSDEKPGEGVYRGVYYWGRIDMADNVGAMCSGDGRNAKEK